MNKNTECYRNFKKIKELRDQIIHAKYKKKNIEIEGIKIRGLMETSFYHNLCAMDCDLCAEVVKCFIVSTYLLDDSIDIDQDRFLIQWIGTK